MTHTPGPWSIRADGSDIPTAIVGPDQRALAQIPWTIRRAIGIDVTDANARLIAAAPELLAACKMALGAFEHNHAIDWKVLENAIAKAEEHAK